MATTRFLTFSLGDGPAYNARAHLAMLAMMGHAPVGSEFLLITDRPQNFRWFAGHATISGIDEATLKSWKGPQDFFWRVEIEVLRHAASFGPANLCYFDSDVLVRKPVADLVAALEAGDVFMHTHEFDLAISPRRGQRELWKLVQGLTLAGSSVVAPAPMWNAGVMAVGAQNIGLVDQVLAACDQLTGDGITHFLTEQFAYSHVFGATGRLRAAESWMDHFWCNKPGYDQSIYEQLAQIHYRGLSVPDAVAFVRANPILRPLVVRRRWWNRFFAPLSGLQN
jgi:hypothetical protein